MVAEAKREHDEGTIQTKFASKSGDEVKLSIALAWRKYSRFRPEVPVLVVVPHLRHLRLVPPYSNQPGDMLQHLSINFSKLYPQELFIPS